MATFERTTAVADKVLAQVQVQLRGRPDVHVVVYPYYNGRERGWTLTVAGVYMEGPGVTFSECRNSDEIVLYPGTDPYLHGAQPVTEAVYAEKIFCPVGHHKRAAAYVVRCLLARVASAKRRAQQEEAR